jgi:hypothetical protein
VVLPCAALAAPTVTRPSQIRQRLARFDPRLPGEIFSGARLHERARLIRRNAIEHISPSKIVAIERYGLPRGMCPF